MGRSRGVGIALVSAREYITDLPVAMHQRRAAFPGAMMLGVFCFILATYDHVDAQSVDDSTSAGLVTLYRLGSKPSAQCILSLGQMNYEEISMVTLNINGKDKQLDALPGNAIFVGAARCR
jgi:hypothetical protein